MNYYDEDFYEGLTEDERNEDNELECRVMENRSRYSLEDALKFDKTFINDLLNKDVLSKAEKHWIAVMHERVCDEFLGSNRTTKSFEEFMKERVGERKYENLVSEWIRQQGNEFFQRVGMEDEMQPSAIYFMGIDTGE